MKAPRLSFLPILLNRKMLDMVDSCQSCSGPLFFWKQNKKTMLPLTDMCCDMSWHSILVIVAVYGVHSCASFPVAGTVASTGGVFPSS